MSFVDIYNTIPMSCWTLSFSVTLLQLVHLENCMCCPTYCLIIINAHNSDFYLYCLLTKRCLHEGHCLKTMTVLLMQLWLIIFYSSGQSILIFVVCVISDVNGVQTYVTYSEIISLLCYFLWIYIIYNSLVLLFPLWQQHFWAAWTVKPVIWCSPVLKYYLLAGLNKKILDFQRGLWLLDSTACCSDCHSICDPTVCAAALDWK